MVIKLADISNEMRAIEISEPWIDRLLQEFFHQSELEKATGLPVTPFMDPDKVNKPASQVSFITKTLEPTLDALGLLFPQLVDSSSSDSLITSTMRTLSFYQQLRDQHDIPAVVLEHQPAAQTPETAATEKTNHVSLAPMNMHLENTVTVSASRKSSRTGSLPCAVHYDVRESSILRAARNRNNYSNPHIHVPPTPPPEPEVAVAVAQPRFRDDYEFEDSRIEGQVL